MKRLLALFTLALLLVGCAREVPPASLPLPEPFRPSPASPAAAEPAAPEPAGWPTLDLELVAEGFDKPLGLVHAGGELLYVLEQRGVVKIMGRDEPFLDISDRVLSSGMEQGLLGLAFAPDFAESGVFYVHYTGKPRGQTVVSRFKGEALRGDPGSEEILLTIEQPFANHNGGPLLFGPDGYLYLALGDGGSGGDPGNRAQDLGVLLGKILRLEVSGQGPYTIPPDNPFVGELGAREEIWAYGLRNPWRVSFDRLTGDLYIADVGQNEREEVNFQPALSPGGENYGWRIFEGTARYSEGELPGAVFPVVEYSHGQGECSITGGYVYRGSKVAGLEGIYLFGDFCSGKIWGTRAGTWETELLLVTDLRLTAFGEDAEGELYAVDQRGKVYRVVEGR